MDLILQPYSTLWATLAGPLHTISMQFAQALLTYVNANARTAIVLMVSLFVLRQALNVDEHLPLHFAGKLAGIAFFMGTALAWPMYHQFVLLIEHLPASLIAAASGQPPQENWARALEVALASAKGPIGKLSAAIEGSFWSVSLQRASAFVILTAADVLATLGYFVVFIINAFLNISLDLLLAIGPLAVVMWLFPLTKNIAVSYLESLMAIVVQMVTMVVVMLVVDRTSDLIAVNLLKINHQNLGAIIQAGLICGSLFLALPFLAIGALYQVNKVFNGVVSGALGSMIGTPGRLASAAINGGGGSSHSIAGSGGSGSSNGMQASGAASAQAMPGRPIGRSP